MNLTIRTADPREDSVVSALLESAFGRVAREARLACALADGHPDYDPALALLAEEEGRALAWMLLFPRRMVMRGCELSLSVLAPIGVIPGAQERGVGRALVEHGLGGLPSRAIRGAVTIGAPEFFSALGFAPAFNLHSVRVPAECLPDEEAPAAWRGLRGEDLAPLTHLQQRAYRGTSGTEVRLATAVDWESATEEAHTLVHEGSHGVDAYLRFRVRDELEVTECAALDASSVAAVLGLLGRLVEEHARQGVDVHVAPPHPIALALFARGCMLETSNFGGASVLKVIDWQGFFEDLAPWWRPKLAALREGELSLEFDGEVLCLRADGSVTRDEPRQRHLWIPTLWCAGLITGQRCAEELWIHSEVLERSSLDRAGLLCVARLFRRAPAQWVYSPAYELADD